MKIVDFGPKTLLMTKNDLSIAIIKEKTICGVMSPLKGRVQAKRAFLSFLELKTSFLAYICILGLAKKKFDHFWRPYWKKGPKIVARALALTSFVQFTSDRLDF